MSFPSVFLELHLHPFADALIKGILAEQSVQLDSDMRQRLRQDAERKVERLTDRVSSLEKQLSIFVESCSGVVPSHLKESITDSLNRLKDCLQPMEMDTKTLLRGFATNQQIGTLPVVRDTLAKQFERFNRTEPRLSSRLSPTFVRQACQYSIDASDKLSRLNRHWRYYMMGHILSFAGHVECTSTQLALLCNYAWPTSNVTVKRLALTNKSYSDQLDFLARVKMPQLKRFELRLPRNDKRRRAVFEFVKTNACAIEVLVLGLRTGVHGPYGDPDAFKHLHTLRLVYATYDTLFSEHDLRWALLIARHVQLLVIQVTGLSQAASSLTHEFLVDPVLPPMIVFELNDEEDKSRRWQVRERMHGASLVYRNYSTHD